MFSGPCWTENARSPGARLMKHEDVVKKRSLAWIVALSTVPLLLHLPIVSAAEPAIVWSAPGMQEGFFSKDGAWAVLTGNSSAGGRIEVRSAGTGALVSALANPLGFTAVALTRDNQ